MAETSTPRVMRTYTRGLSIPKLIGRLADGTRLPGGPYTFAQFLTGAGAVVIGYFTLPFWAQALPSLSVITNEMVGYLVLLPAGWGVAWLAGLIPADVNPVYAVRGIASGARPSRYGRLGDRPVLALPEPRASRARVRVEGRWVSRPSVLVPDVAVAAPAVSAERAEQTNSAPAAVPQGKPSLAAFRAAIVKE